MKDVLRVSNLKERGRNAKRGYWLSKWEWWNLKKESPWQTELIDLSGSCLLWEIWEIFRSQSTKRCSVSDHSVERPGTYVSAISPHPRLERESEKPSLLYSSPGIKCLTALSGAPCRQGNNPACQIPSSLAGSAPPLSSPMLFPGVLTSRPGIWVPTMF